MMLQCYFAFLCSLCDFNVCVHYYCLAYGLCLS